MAVCSNRKGEEEKAFKYKEESGGLFVFVCAYLAILPINSNTTVTL